MLTALHRMIADFFFDICLLQSKVRDLYNSIITSGIPNHKLRLQLGWWFNNKFLNTITSLELPNHKLRLKVGVSDMLFRIIDQNLGLNNGTRLIITKMRKYVLEWKVVSRSNIGDKVFMPRLTLPPSDVKISLKFQQSQFPLSISFVIIINKIQEQFLKHVGIYCQCRCFHMVSYMLQFQELLQKKCLKYW